VNLSDDSIHGAHRSARTRPLPRRFAGRQAHRLSGFDDKRLGYQATQLYVMDIDGSHSHSLTPNLDRDAAAPKWTGDSRQLLFQYDDRGSTKIAAIDLGGKCAFLADDLGGNDVSRPYSGGSFSSAANGRFAYTRAAPLAPAALATGTSPHDIAALTALSDPLLHGELSVRSKKYPSTPRSIIAAFRMDSPNRRIRCLQEISLAARDSRRAVCELWPSFAAEIQLYAAAGYVVCISIRAAARVTAKSLPI